MCFFVVLKTRIPDNMTLQEAQQRSAYMLREKKGIRRFTPDDWIKKGKEPAVRDERPGRSTAVRRMRSIDSDDEDEDELEIDEQPQRVGTKKIPPKRGRGTMSLRTRK